MLRKVGGKLLGQVMKGPVGAGIRAGLARLDAVVPEGVQGKLPEVWLRVGDGSVLHLKGLKFERVVPSSPVEGGEDPNFWQGLPPGYHNEVIHGPAPEKSAHLPRNEEEVRTLVARLRAVLGNLDDVKDFETVGKIDEELYQLWRELERKMQNHRQSEAKHQLKDMFRL